MKRKKITESATFTLGDIMQAVASIGSTSETSVIDRLDGLYEKAVGLHEKCKKKGRGGKAAQASVSNTRRFFVCKPGEVVWNENEANARLRKWAHADDGANTHYGSAFLIRPDSNQELFDGYKYQIADVSGSVLVVVPEAVCAARAAVESDASLSEDEKTEALASLDVYEKDISDIAEGKYTRSSVESIAASVASDMFYKERQALGLDEEHPNLFFVDVLLTHADKTMNNALQSVVSLDEMRASEKSIMLQPMDVSPDFDRHMRERFWDDNGIRGVIYASRIVDVADGPAEFWVGAAIWARDFPEIADSIVVDGDILGASFDLQYDRASDNADYSTNLYGVKWLGGTILYQTRAADKDTRLGSMNYCGSRLDNDSTKGSKSMDNDGKGEIDNAVVAKAQEVVASQMSTIAELAARVSALEAENEQLKSDSEAVATALETANARLESIAKAEREAEFKSARMAELDTIGMAFVDDEDRASAEARVGTMEDSEYAAYKAEVMASAAARREQDLQRLLDEAREQIRKMGASHEDSTSEASAADTDAQSAGDAQASIRPGSMSAMNADATGNAGANARECGRDIAAVLNSKRKK